MKRADALRLLCLAAMLVLCAHSALNAVPSEFEHAHNPSWFVLSVPGAAYLLFSLARSWRSLAGGNERCRTG
ncbi:MAG: hypothetical protein JTT11_04140 [Candidatus Brockarchaeota archaeon]|nr:hypothetical protein [Candidatus Brockarchaeota archaeon]